MRHLVWAAVALAILGGAWLWVFGTSAPCDAMRQTGAELARETGGEDGKLIRRAMDDQFSTIQCIGLTVHMKISGKGAIKIIH